MFNYLIVDSVCQRFYSCFLLEGEVLLFKKAERSRKIVIQKVEILLFGYYENKDENS